jgi:hypothetical protein
MSHVIKAALVWEDLGLNCGDISNKNNPMLAPAAKG